MDRVGGVGGTEGVAAYTIESWTLKPRFSKDSRDVGIDSVWGIHKAGTDYIK